MSDLIRRQDALDILGEEPFVWYGGWDEIAKRNQWRRAVKAIKAVPSVQSEIIRCKDCKHRDPEDKKCDCGHDILWQLPRDDNWFCADAERRTDEA